MEILFYQSNLAALALNKKASRLYGAFDQNKSVTIKMN